MTVAAMQMLTLSRYRPSVIQFEHGHLYLNQVGEIAKLLAPNNYVLYWGGHQTDSLAIPAELFEQSVPRAERSSVSSHSAQSADNCWPEL